MFFILLAPGAALACDLSRVENKAAFDLLSSNIVETDKVLAQARADVAAAEAALAALLAQAAPVDEAARIARLDAVEQTRARWRERSRFVERLAQARKRMDIESQRYCP